MNLAAARSAIRARVARGALRKAPGMTARQAATTNRQKWVDIRGPRHPLVDLQRTVQILAGSAHHTHNRGLARLSLRVSAMP